jgi:hypothetical protein
MSITVAAADALAEAAHEGQVDKAGEPYIDHPRRVAARLDTDDEKIVALLHDVLEDTAVTVTDLRRAGVTTEQFTALAFLTHADHQPYDDYIRDITKVPLACRVKIADIADNADPARLDRLDPATAWRLSMKYARALSILNARAPAQTAIPVRWGMDGPRIGTVVTVDFEHPSGPMASMWIFPNYADRIFGDACHGLSLGFTPATEG